MFVLLAVTWLVVMLAMMVLLMPLMLRATLTQEFARSFDVRFTKQFLALTWKEALFATLFTFAASMVLMILGALVFCIGMYFAGVVSYFSWVHLQKQIYFLYVRRGGEPLTVSPKLFDIPLPLP
jgi:uncharacterized membrane protein YedE/YeeE